MRRNFSLRRGGKALDLERDPNRDKPQLSTDGILGGLQLFSLWTAQCSNTSHSQLQPLSSSPILQESKWLS